MKPGRELDALIAEKVFGWSWSKEKHRVADPEGWSVRNLLIPPNCDWILSTYDLEPGMNSVNIPVPSYSTDIAAAWKVVEKLREKDMDLQLHSFRTCVRAYFDDLEWSEYEEANTAAHAICLAVLKAVEWG